MDVLDKNLNKTYTITITGWKAVVFMAVTIYVFMIGTASLVTTVYRLF